MGSKTLEEAVRTACIALLASAVASVTPRFFVTSSRTQCHCLTSVAVVVQIYGADREHVTVKL